MESYLMFGSVSLFRAGGSGRAWWLVAADEGGARRQGCNADLPVVSSQMTRHDGVCVRVSAREAHCKVPSRKLHPLPDYQVSQSRLNMSQFKYAR